MAQGVPIGIEVGDLRPTQMTVGFREVEVKRRQWREADEVHRSHLLRRHVIPAVVGPKNRAYIVDHHHFARALLEEKAGEVAVYILANLSDLPKPEFWTFLDNSAWCHAYDKHGKRRELDDIPKLLADLADDPYRSLVGALIRHGGCAKSDKPFSEFLWADFLRRRIDEQIVTQDFDAALQKAIAIAKSGQAQSLPGWAGENAGGA
jgi:hypothetical protein